MVAKGESLYSAVPSGAASERMTMAIDSAQNKVEREILVHKLLTGTATQQERDTALATMMLSLWTYADLKTYFLELHQEQCARCPARKRREDEADCGGDGAKSVTIVDSFKEMARTWGWIVLGLVWIVAKLTGTVVPSMASN